MSCPADSAGEAWYRDPVVFAAEVEIHNTNVAIASAHGRDESTYRTWRRRHGIEPCRDFPPIPGSSPDPEIEGVSELERLKQRNRELEQIISRAHKDEILEERMVVSLRDALESVETQYSPAVIAKPTKVDLHEMALLWSDLHAGEVVSLEETNGLNEYNWEIMLRRHDEILRGVLAFKENRPYPVKKLHVWGLGDMASGEIHEELRATNEFPIIETSVKLGLDAGAWLERFVPEFESIDFAGVVGNHGRLYHKPQSKQRYNNFDWLVYHTMQQRLSGYKSIHWEIPKAQKWPVMVCNRRILLSHGDGIRSTMVGVPWGGIIRQSDRLANQYAQAGMPIDHFVYAHWHDPNAVKNRRLIVNGSVIGVNEWAIDTFGSGERPAQVLLTFHPRWGLTDVSFVDLEPSERTQST